MSIYRIFLLSLLLGSLLIYFTYHTFFGKRGYIAKNILESEIVQIHNDLEIARDTRVEIEHNVKLLRPNSLDPDMLEEQAKKILGYAGKKEKVIVTDKEEKEE